jgi:hypothetical protein
MKNLIIAGLLLLVPPSIVVAEDTRPHHTDTSLI